MPTMVTMTLAVMTGTTMTDRRRVWRSNGFGPVIVALLAGLQIVCGAFFVYTLLVGGSKRWNLSSRSALLHKWCEGFTV